MNTQIEAMKLALKAYMAAGFGNSTNFALQGKAYDLAVEALAEQPAQTEQQGQAIDVAFLRQVLSVAIAGLYEHYKDDVLRVFTLGELQTVADLSESLQPQQVEDIYKRAWDMLTGPQLAPEQEQGNKYCCHHCFNKSGQMFLDRMILCPECGNKRCPKATHHDLPCTNSNEPGQPGSIYTTPPTPAQELTDGFYVMQIDGRTKKIWPMSEEQALAVALYGITKGGA